MLKKILIKFAFLLHGSKIYNAVKTLATNFLVNADYNYKKYFDIFMILLIVSSVAILVYEVKNPVPDWVDFFDIYVVTSIFTLEYLARVWVHNSWSKQMVKEHGEAKFLDKSFSIWTPTKRVFKEKFSYLLTPSAIIDLLAILPAYRPLRVLRIFVLFRVFKLLRYTKSIHQFVEVLATKKFELFTLLFLLLFIVATAGIAIYVFEEKANESINSLFDALYWALITISTVGYGDISPVTTEGRMVSMLVIISGIAMISFVTSVIVSSFSEKLDELKENRLVEEINKNENFMIVCGYGQMTRMFLKSYAKEYGTRYIVIEKDKTKVEEATKEGYRAIHEDASRHDVISKFNVEYSNITLLALTGSDVANIYIILNAKALSKSIKIITRATDEGIAKKCKLAGADHVVRPNIVANKMLLTAITQPVMYHAIYAILTGQHLAQLDELMVMKHQKLMGLKIENIDFKRYKLLFIGIQTGLDGAFIFNPPKNRVLKEKDILLLMGRRVSIAHFKESFEELKYVI
jgi:voltage-gated potassium channel